MPEAKELLIDSRDRLILELYEICRHNSGITGFALPERYGAEYKVHINIGTVHSHTFFNTYATMRSFVEELSKLSPPFFIADSRLTGTFHLVPHNVIEWHSTRERVIAQSAAEDERHRQRTRVKAILRAIVYFSGVGCFVIAAVTFYLVYIHPYGSTTNTSSTQPSTAPATKPAK